LEAQDKQYIKVVENGGMIPVGTIATVIDGYDDGILLISSGKYKGMTTSKILWEPYVKPITFPPGLFEL